MQYPNNDLYQSRKICVFQKCLKQRRQSPPPHPSHQQSRGIFAPKKSPAYGCYLQLNPQYMSSRPYLSELNGDKSSIHVNTIRFISLMLMVASLRLGTERVTAARNFKLWKVKSCYAMLRRASQASVPNFTSDIFVLFCSVAMGYHQLLCYFVIKYYYYYFFYYYYHFPFFLLLPDMMVNLMSLYVLI